jgi:hypothetical protein
VVKKISKIYLSRIPELSLLLARHSELVAVGPVLLEYLHTDRLHDHLINLYMIHLHDHLINLHMIYLHDHLINIYMLYLHDHLINLHMIYLHDNLNNLINLYKVCRYYPVTSSAHSYTWTLWFMMPTFFKAESRDLWHRVAPGDAARSEQGIAAI